MRCIISQRNAFDAPQLPTVERLGTSCLCHFVRLFLCMLDCRKRRIFNQRSKQESSGLSTKSLTKNGRNSFTAPQLGFPTQSFEIVGVAAPLCASRRSHQDAATLCRGCVGSASCAAAAKQALIIQFTQTGRYRQTVRFKALGTGQTFGGGANGAKSSGGHVSQSCALHEIQH